MPNDADCGYKLLIFKIAIEVIEILKTKRFNQNFTTKLKKK